MKESVRRRISLRGKGFAATFRRDLDVDGVQKKTVIGIAAAATVLVLAILCGCLFFFLQRRKRNGKGKGHARTVSTDPDTNDHALHISQSRTPLMRQDNSSQMSQHQTATISKHSEEHDIAMAASTDLHRSPSIETTRSLPPSYLAATHGSIRSAVRAPSPNPHRPNSSFNGSDGLRPLMLVNAHQNHSEDDRDDDGDTTRREANTLPFASLKPTGRPRAGSRFVEEDLDM